MPIMTPITQEEKITLKKYISRRGGLNAAIKATKADKDTLKRLAKSGFAYEKTLEKVLPFIHELQESVAA